VFIFIEPPLVVRTLHDGGSSVNGGSKIFPGGPQLYICSGVHLFRCTFVQVYICSGVHLFRCTFVQVYICAHYLPTVQWDFISRLLLGVSGFGIDNLYGG
jgi:hypothetical protein